MKFVLIKKKGLVQLIAVLLILVASAVGIGITGSAQVYNGKINKKMPICSIDTQEKAVALSFDVCFGNENVQSILDILNRQDAVASFFVVGSWAEQYADELKALADSGRAEIGTHANTHASLKKAGKKIDLELTTSVSIIESITEKKVELFRAPYGEYNDSVIGAADKCGLYTIQYDVDTRDQTDAAAIEIAGRVLDSVQNGSIILMHTDSANTLKALPVIIEGLRNKGYSLKTIGEMIYRENFVVDSTGKQIRR